LNEARAKAAAAMSVVERKAEEDRVPFDLPLM
jgi:hypothetical protein